MKYSETCNATNIACGSYVFPKQGCTFLMQATQLMGGSIEFILR
jgi:hypothetical protein